MFRLKRKGAAVADAPIPTAGHELRAEIDRLTAVNRAQRSRSTERRLLALRHQLGIRMLEDAGPEPEYPDPAGAAPPQAGDLPEVTPDQLTPELLRAGILRDGCVLVRGLVPRADARALAAQIDRAYAEREKALQFQPSAEGYYEEFQPDERYGEVEVRPWIYSGGGLLAGDAPMLLFETLELFQAAGITRLVEAYLGEPPLLTFEKTTLRRAEPTVPGAWHQDGKFMGPVRALNLWLSLSRCGDEAPGLDLVPRRLSELVTAGDQGSFLDYQVSDATAAAAAAPKQVIRPIFEPGDALLFDELFLHQTASDAAMPNPRHAVESWFFGASAFPSYAPIAV